MILLPAPLTKGPKLSFLQTTPSVLQTKRIKYSSFVSTLPTHTRSFRSATKGNALWLAGDPHLDDNQSKARVEPISLSPELVQRQVFRLQPSGHAGKREEWFRLSSLDLFNTQNYSTHALVFKLEDSEKPAILNVIKQGLQNTLGQCRHMVGTIEQNDHGGYCIAKKSDSAVDLVIQWLDRPGDDYPSFSDLARSMFTAGSMGDPARLTIAGMTMGCRRPPDTKPPMTAFQLNFIPGGLIFTVHKHHAALDMAGTTSLVHQIADNCRSIMKGTPKPSWDENLMDRSRFIADVPRDKRADPPPLPGRHPDWLPCSWLLFHLPRSKAAELKKLAAPEEEGSWISTHDALTAYLWRVLSQHRAQIYNPDRAQPALYFEAVNMRDRVTPKVPARFQGNVLGAGVSTNQPNPLTLAEVISDVPLSKLALFIRKLTSSIDQASLEKTLEMLASFRDKWKLHPRLDAIPPLSFVVTDWRMASICDADFGFGRPAAFRQLSDVVVENMMVIYPPLEIEGDTNQGVEVMVPFEKHYVEELLKDPSITRFFEFRGFEACPP